MRISIFSAFYPFRGGIAQFNAKLFREFQDRGHTVKAFTFTKQYPKFLFPGKTQKVSHTDLADKIPAKRIIYPFNPFSYFKARRVLKQSQPDLFISNYWMTFFGICFGFLANSFSKKTVKVGLIHNLIPHEPKFFDSFFSKFYLKRHDAFIVLSEAVKNDVLKLKPNAKVLQLYHPWYDHFGEKVEKLKARVHLKIDPNKRTILFFGLIRVYKGLDLLLESFSLLSDEYQLVIAGEAYEDIEKYQAMINQSPNKERIHFHNRYIDDAEVANYFSAADVCTLPYRSATQSGITAVAFHFEVPVVVTDVGGLRKTVEEIGAGKVVQNGNKNEFSAQVIHSFEGDFLSQCQSNIQKAKSLNSWVLFANKLEEFYIQVASEKTNQQKK